MLDTQLRARLIKLGMPGNKANRTAALIRDRLHPVAVVAASRLSGCGMDGLGKLKIKKALKKIGKELKPKNLLHEATHPLSHIKRSTRLSAPVLRVAAPIVTAINPVIGAAVTAGAVAGTALENQRKKKKLKAELSKALAEGGTVPVPTEIAKEGTDTAANYPPEAPIDTANILRDLLAQGGTTMSSPQAQKLLQDVAAEGVEATPAGPSALPPWLLPVGAAALGLLLLLPKRGSR